MRKTLRLLDWIVSDIDEAKKKLEAVIDDDLSGNVELERDKRMQWEMAVADGTNRARKKPQRTPGPLSAARSSVRGADQ